MTQQFNIKTIHKSNRVYNEICLHEFMLKFNISKIKTKYGRIKYNQLKIII